MTTQKRRVIYMTDQEWSALQDHAKGRGATASAIIRKAVDAFLAQSGETAATIVAKPDSATLSHE